MTTPKNSVAVIIVSWNTRDYLALCLASLFRNIKDLSAQVVVIDNASSDDSVEMLRNEYAKVHIICNNENFGFAKACNQGVAATDAPFVLFLNSDCELVNDCITPLVQVLTQNPQIGIAGSVLLHPNRKIQKAGGDMLTLRKVCREQLFLNSAALFAPGVNTLDQICGTDPYFKTDFISGASLCIPRKVLDQIGLLREDFFLYGEDLELCLRAHCFGYETVIVKQSQVIHHRNKSTNKNLQDAVQHTITNTSILLATLEGDKAAYLALLYYFLGGSIRMVLAFFRKGISPLSWAKVLWNYPDIIRNVQAGIRKTKLPRIYP